MVTPHWSRWMMNPDRHNPFARDWLEVGDGHRLYLAQFGNPEGIPLLYLHGGPGAGCSLEELALFDLRRFRLLFLDQRGAGLSRSEKGLAQNHFQGLLDDLESVRKALRLPRWCLAGGSFGATLGLVYGGLFPERVIAQTYWGSFIPSAEGRDWLYGAAGAASRFPVDYHGFSRWLSRSERSTAALLESYAKGFTCLNAQDYIRSWLRWEQHLSLPGVLLPPPRAPRDSNMARIELHYARHHYFEAMSLFDAGLNNWPKQTCLLQGENDWVCPTHLLQAQLARQIRPAELQLVAGGHHSLVDDKMRHAVVAALCAMGDTAASCETELRSQD
ncbi:alpha/beta fold hydrolase [Shewanella algae]|uniref:alpha/beta fold hydrolase n=1 Tax=Shewanella algae TaxID=38313 RepID=UPI001FB8BDBB|nr:alpha/beta fold hydrolase [Shewanella algae]